MCFISDLVHVLEERRRKYRAQSSPGSINRIINIARIISVIRVFKLGFAFPSGMQNLYRRAVLMRALHNFVFFESLEESALHTIITSCVLAHAAVPVEIVWLPVEMFGLCSLPLHMLGLRDLVLLRAVSCRCCLLLKLILHV